MVEIFRAQEHSECHAPVHNFTSGKAIVREASRESFDLFMLDWHVPDLSGEEVVRWLREKLEEDASNPRRIVTVRGVGYRFEG